jgi:hypothetical protein
VKFGKGITRSLQSELLRRSAYVSHESRHLGLACRQHVNAGTRAATLKNALGGFEDG